MHFVAAIHGINTGLTSASWPWRLQAYWVRRGYEVVLQADHYFARAMPWWNTHVLNPRHGKAVARRLELLHQEFPDLPISMVAHSNGGDVAVNAVKELVSLGIDVDTIVLIGSAVENDIVKNGLLPLIRRGRLKRAVAYCSPKDKVIKPLQFFPGHYGPLGARGWERDKQPAGAILSPEASGKDYDSFLNRWFREYSHSEYFTRENSFQTFDMIARDIGLEVPYPPDACAMLDRK